MARSIRVMAGDVAVAVRLNDSPTAQALWEALPLEASAQTWGDEIYFPTGLRAQVIGEREVVEVGAVAYWPRGDALCLFFGPTPASQGPEPRAASAVLVVGHVEGDPSELKRVPAGAPVRVERVQP